MTKCFILTGKTNVYPDYIGNGSFQYQRGATIDFDTHMPFDVINEIELGKEETIQLITKHRIANSLCIEGKGRILSYDVREGFIIKASISILELFKEVTPIPPI